MPLNQILDPELRISLYILAQVWDLLPQVRRTALRSTVAAVNAEEKLEAYEIKKLALLRRSPWEWAVSDSQGKEHVIPKAYPGTPIPGEAERAQSAPPIRWLNPAVTVLITAVCLEAGLLGPDCPHGGPRTAGLRRHCAGRERESGDRGAPAGA